MMEYYGQLNISSNESLDKMTTELNREKFMFKIRDFEKSDANKHLQDLDILDENGVVVFVGVSDTKLGVIRKITPNVFDLFGYSESEMLNSNIK